MITAESPSVDVAICGGGLAGLTLARQLRRELPELSLTVLEKLPLPLPEAVFKVGESTVEISAHYLAQVLALESVLEAEHLHKLGLRFFIGGGDGPLARRPELGLSRFPAVHSYQLDRGRLETSLRALVVDDGAQLIDGCKVESLTLGSGGAPHKVTYTQGDTEGNLRCRWLIDAMGRRSLLQRQLGLRRSSEHPRSAVWMRFEGRIDVSDLVPTEETTWHERVPDDRYLSTNHLMGSGYWVWLIPLSSGFTSVGIVVDEALHPAAELTTLPQARRWLASWEPELADALAGRDPADFQVRRNYSSTTSQLFGKDRWFCTGDAGAFSDPFYSPGLIHVSLTNCAIAHLIAEDRRSGRPSPDLRRLDSFLVGYNEGLIFNIQPCYRHHGKDLVMAAKILWDFAFGWGEDGSRIFDRSYLDPERSAQISRAGGKLFALAVRMQSLFLAWGERSCRRGSFDFIDYLALPVLVEIRTANLQSYARLDELLGVRRRTVALLEALARALFLVAVEDLCPQHLDRARSCGLASPRYIDLPRILQGELDARAIAPLTATQAQVAADVRALFRL